MTTQNRLIAALLAAFPDASQADIARKCGLSPPRFNNYTQGSRSMDDDAVIGCARALGMDARALVAEHRADVAKTERERRFWRKLQSVAMPIMSSGRAWIRRVVTPLARLLPA